MFAVIKSGGRQYKVSVGDTFEVNRLTVEDGEAITFDEVLLIGDEDTTMIGTPFVENAQVLATAVKQTRGKKLIVFRYKPKKRFRHKRGHRQDLTVLRIEDIIADGKSLITGKAPEARETVAPQSEVTTQSDEMATPTLETTSTETTPPPADAGGTRRRRTVRTEDTEPENETEE